MTGKEYIKDWVKLCDSCNAVNRCYGSYDDDGVQRLVEKAFNDGAASRELEIKELKEQIDYQAFVIKNQHEALNGKEL